MDRGIRYGGTSDLNQRQGSGSVKTGVYSYRGGILLMRFNYPVIANLFGYLLLLNGVFMLTCLPFSVHYNEGDHVALLGSALITLASGTLLIMITRNPKSKS